MKLDEIAAMLEQARAMRTSTVNGKNASEWALWGHVCDNLTKILRARLNR